MKKTHSFKHGDRAVLPAGTFLRNTSTCNRSLVNDAGTLAEPLIGTLRDARVGVLRSHRLGQWFQFVPDEVSGSSALRSRFGGFLYPEADLQPAPDSDWTPVAVALPEANRWVLGVIAGAPAPVTVRLNHNGDWFAWGPDADAYVMHGITHWTPVPELPAVVTPTRAFKVGDKVQIVGATVPGTRFGAEFVGKRATVTRVDDGGAVIPYRVREIQDGGYSVWYPGISLRPAT